MKSQTRSKLATRFCATLLLLSHTAVSEAATRFEVGTPEGPAPAIARTLDAEIRLSPRAGALQSEAAEIHIVDATGGKLDSTPPNTLKATLIAAAVGLGSGALSYGLWVILHEGAHAVAIEAAGGDVVQFDFTPDRLEGGGIRFAAVYWQDPAGQVTPTESGWIDIAPNITGLTLGTIGSALWLADALPKSRLARMAFASFQIGAAINGGIIGVWSSHPDVDIPKAIQAFELSEEQALIFRSALTAGAILNLIPAVDSIVYGLTGRSIVSRLGWRSERSEIQVIPVALPNFFGVGATF